MVIAKNINISNNVTQLDGVYIAQSGKVNTCSAVSENGSGFNLSMKPGSACNGNAIKINGAIVSEENVILNRTYGGGDLSTPSREDNRKAAAETINYTPNTFLVPYYLGNLGGDIEGFKTTSATSLPVRY